MVAVGGRHVGGRQHERTPSRGTGRHGFDVAAADRAQRGHAIAIVHTRLGIGVGVAYHPWIGGNEQRRVRPRKVPAVDTETVLERDGIVPFDLYPIIERVERGGDVARHGQDVDAALVAGGQRCEAAVEGDDAVRVHHARDRREVVVRRRPGGQRVQHDAVAGDAVAGLVRRLVGPGDDDAVGVLPVGSRYGEWRQDEAEAAGVTPLFRWDAIGVLGLDAVRVAHATDSARIAITLHPGLDRAEQAAIAVDVEAHLEGRTIHPGHADLVAQGTVGGGHVVRRKENATASVTDGFGVGPEGGREHQAVGVLRAARALRVRIQGPVARCHGDLCAVAEDRDRHVGQTQGRPGDLGFILEDAVGGGDVAGEDQVGRDAGGHKDRRTGEDRVVAAVGQVAGAGAHGQVEAPVAGQAGLVAGERVLHIGQDPFARAEDVPQPHLVELPGEVLAGGFVAPHDERGRIRVGRAGRVLVLGDEPAIAVGAEGLAIVRGSQVVPAPGLQRTEGGRELRAADGESGGPTCGRVGMVPEERIVGATLDEDGGLRIGGGSISLHPHLQRPRIQILGQCGRSGVIDTVEDEGAGVAADEQVLPGLADATEGDGASEGVDLGRLGGGHPRAIRPAGAVVQLEATGQQLVVPVHLFGRGEDQVGGERAGAKALQDPVLPVKSRYAGRNGVGRPVDAADVDRRAVLGGIVDLQSCAREVHQAAGLGAGGHDSRADGRTGGHPGSAALEQTVLPGHQVDGRRTGAFVERPVGEQPVHGAAKDLVHRRTNLCGGAGGGPDADLVERAVEEVAGGRVGLSLRQRLEHPVLPERPVRPGTVIIENGRQRALGDLNAVAVDRHERRGAGLLHDHGQVLLPGDAGARQELFVSKEDPQAAIIEADVEEVLAAVSAAVVTRVFGDEGAAVGAALRVDPHLDGEGVGQHEAGRTHEVVGTIEVEGRAGDGRCFLPAGQDVLPALRDAGEGDRAGGLVHRGGTGREGPGAVAVAVAAEELDPAGCGGVVGRQPRRAEGQVGREGAAGVAGQEPVGALEHLDGRPARRILGRPVDPVDADDGAAVGEVVRRQAGSRKVDQAIRFRFLREDARPERHRGGGPPVTAHERPVVPAHEVGGRAARALVEQPVGDEARLRTGQGMVHRLAHLPVRAGAGPEPHLVERHDGVVFGRAGGGGRAQEERLPPVHERRRGLRARAVERLRDAVHVDRHLVGRGIGEHPGHVVPGAVVEVRGDVAGQHPPGAIAHVEQRRPRAVAHGAAGREQAVGLDGEDRRGGRGRIDLDLHDRAGGRRSALHPERDGGRLQTSPEVAQVAHVEVVGAVEVGGAPGERAGRAAPRDGILAERRDAGERDRACAGVRCKAVGDDGPRAARGPAVAAQQLEATRVGGVARRQAVDREGQIGREGAGAEALDDPVPPVEEGQRRAAGRVGRVEVEAGDGDRVRRGVGREGYREAGRGEVDRAEGRRGRGARAAADGRVGGSPGGAAVQRTIMPADNIGRRGAGTFIELPVGHQPRLRARHRPVHGFANVGLRPRDAPDTHLLQIPAEPFVQVTATPSKIDGMSIGERPHGGRRGYLLGFTVHVEGQGALRPVVHARQMVPGAIVEVSLGPG